MSTAEGGGNIVTDGLVLYLDAANSKSIVSGSTTWTDLSRSNNKGTLLNGPSFNYGNGGSIVFDGTNDYVITNSDISSYKVNSNFTISTWTNVSTTTNNAAGIFGCFDDNLESSVKHTGYSLWVKTGESRFSFLIGSGSNTFTYIPANSNYQTNTWYNLTGINTGGISYFYINGVLQNATSNATILLPEHPVKIGRGYEYTNNYYYNGKVAQGIIYNRALTPQEVLQNFNATKKRFGL